MVDIHSTSDTEKRKHNSTNSHHLKHFVVLKKILLHENIATRYFLPDETIKDRMGEQLFYGKPGELLV